MSQDNPGDQELDVEVPVSQAPNITNVPWSVRDALLGVVLLIPVSMIFVLVFLLSGNIIGFLTGTGAPSFLNVIALGGATFITGIGLAWLLGVKRRGGSLANLGLTDFKVWADIPLAFLGEIIIFIGLATYSIVLFKVSGERVPEQPIDQLFGKSLTGFLLAVFFVAILAPIGEEIFFRGFVYTALRKKWGVPLAMVASSGLFAVFHIVPLLYPPMFIIGMVLVVLFEQRRSLAPNIILHALNNFLALLAVYGSSL